MSIDDILQEIVSLGSHIEGRPDYKYIPGVGIYRDLNDRTSNEPEVNYG